MFKTSSFESVNQENLQETLAKRELLECGIEPKTEHITAVLQMMETSNFPAGFDDIIENLRVPEKLKTVMQERNITSIIHAEGATVWEHVKAVIKMIDSLEVPEDEKKELRLIMLYHDIGKTEVWKKEENMFRTRKYLDEKRSLHVSMIGHEHSKLDQMREGLSAEGVDGQKLERFMNVILNHMNISILEQDPRKTFKLMEGFGETEEERKATVRLLANALVVDGLATQKVDLVGDTLEYGRNEKKIAFTFETLWSKYEEGKQLIEKEKQAQEKKEQYDKLELVVLGAKLSEYLKQKGVVPGREMGKKMAEVKNVITSNADKNVEEIRMLVEKLF